MLLVVFLLPFWGNYCYVYLLKVEIKQEVSEKISSNQLGAGLVELTFSVEETKTKLRWEHEREFEYKGQMYDIVEIKRATNGTITYTCWPDDEETKLNKKLEQLVRNEQPTKRPLEKQSQWFTDFLKSLYLSTEVSFYTTFSISEIKSHGYEPPVGELNCFAKPPSPPPQS